MNDWMDELDEIIALNSPRVAPPNSYTVGQYVDRVEEKTGIRLSRPAARARLDALVKQSRLGTKLAYKDGREKRHYWLLNAPQAPETGEASASS